MFHILLLRKEPNVLMLQHTGTPLLSKILQALYACMVLPSTPFLREEHMSCRLLASKFRRSRLLYVVCLEEMVESAATNSQCCHISSIGFTRPYQSQPRLSLGPQAASFCRILLNTTLPTPNQNSAARLHFLISSSDDRVTRYTPLVDDHTKLTWSHQPYRFVEHLNFSFCSPCLICSLPSFSFARLDFGRL
mmetsp:Transcript_89097/g.186166  ORF Transcript_89097/g.186166 Transcript_89097/m.186166 type:complete len:192 (-) Transcript_89097:90-665(-)